jgi:hypothetical protein
LAVNGSDEKLTVAAAAKMVDDLYNRNPCIPAEEQEPVPDAEVTDIEDAGNVLNVDLCAQLKSGDYTTKIRVIKSHPDIPHTSVIVGPGTIESTVPTEAVVTYVVDVETAESATLLYPVVTDDFEAVWTGISGPEINRHCEELTWKGVTTGRLTITHPTKYDLVTVEVPGVSNYEGSDRGEPQEFELLVFYNHQAYKEQFESPLDYDSIGEVCGWYSSSVTIPEDPEDPYPEPPPEPEDPCQETVMDRYNTSYKPGTQPFDSDKCCGVPPVMGADCMVMKVGTVQSKEMTPEAKAYYESLGNYCYAGLCTPVSAVEFKAVGPAPGETCGNVIHKTVIIDQDCCAIFDPVDGSADNPTEISSNSSVQLSVNGGGPILTWEAGGDLYFINAYGKRVDTIKTVNSHPASITVYSSKYFCENSSIQVTDECTTVSIPLHNSDASPLVLCDGDNTDIVVVPGGYYDFGLTVHGGVPPYIGWSSDELEHIGSGLFKAPDDFCGVATVHVTDSCGSSASCTSRSSEGRWLSRPQDDFDTCSLPIPGLLMVPESPMDPSASTGIFVGGGYRANIYHQFDIADMCSDSERYNVFCPLGTILTTHSTSYYENRCIANNGECGYGPIAVKPWCCLIEWTYVPDCEIAPRWAYMIFADKVVSLHDWVCE